MYRILETGRTGLDALQKKMDTISNNLANLQTTGYKSLEVQFEDLIYDQVANKGVPLSREAREMSMELGTGSKIKDVQRQWKQGELEETSSPLDLAIEGKGFFGVEDKNGRFFLTRDGAFHIDGNGQLVDSRGNLVVAQINASLFQWKQISIDEEGRIFGKNQWGNSQEIGKIRLFDITNQNRLINVGENYFSVENEDILLTSENMEGEWGKICQGFLERSNVDPTKEMVNMLITQRAYQMNTKSITAADEMWSMVNQLRR
ncbi:flagellar hook-basal body protein [Garciella nitratireducens]|uniref:flagellar hook-basal body protein n=1 Tax=Garciella nitratireducens TaxID=218205 RepID=UPI000DEA8E06|nr:flagellar hook-basal body complex protein [Garciella nitratireducens]RBP46743.1 flagellar basal-body rod protein FlgG [Garciella nitratireducens]